MKLKESPGTSVGSPTLAPQNKTSLLHKASLPGLKQTSVTVFLDHGLQKTQAVLSPELLTIELLIEKALDEFDVLCAHKLRRKGERWVLYACKRNGRVHGDYPSMEPTQPVQLTGFSCFYLCRQNHLSRQPKGSS